MSNNYSIINGEFIPKNEARISISDLAIQRGYGIFDYFRTVNFNPLFLEDHLDRFYYSASEMHLEVEQNREQLKELIYHLIEKNNLPDSGIKLTLTGGYSDDGYSMGNPNLIITQSIFKYDPGNFEKGLCLMTYNHQRQLPQVKTIDYLQAVRLQPLLKEKNAEDILYHKDGEITECPRANFFVVTQDDEIITADENVLKGITRKKVLELEGFAFKEKNINLRDIPAIKEAFISSTTKNILPVLKIDGKKIGNGIPGEITTAIYNKICAIKESA